VDDWYFTAGLAVYWLAGNMDPKIFSVPGSQGPIDQPSYGSWIPLGDNIRLGSDDVGYFAI
jgi:hypothetical protein